MKKWMIWLGLTIVIVVGGVFGVGKWFDPKDACLNSGGHWIEKHCEY